MFKFLILNPLSFPLVGWMLPVINEGQTDFLLGNVLNPEHKNILKIHHCFVWAQTSHYGFN